MDAIAALASFLASIFVVIAPSAVYIPQMQALLKVCPRLTTRPLALALHNAVTRVQSEDLYRVSGFSIGVPITLLVATILKLHFWFGAMFSLVLLAQCLLLAVVQAILLFLCFSKAPPRGIVLASATLGPAHHIPPVIPSPPPPPRPYLLQLQVPRQGR